MDLLLQQFIPEARDLLEASSTALLTLESDPTDDAAINGLFRSVHTLKGTAGIFDIPAFTKLVHAAEDVLNLVREHQIVLEPVLVDQLLAGMDLLSNWVDWLGREGALPADAASVGAVHIATYRSRVTAGPPAGAKPPAENPAAAGSAAPAVPGWVADFDEIDRLAAASILAGLGEGARLLAIEYRPDPQCFYAGEDPLYAVRQIPGLLAFSWTHREDWEELRAADLFTCRVVLRVLADAPRQSVDELFRYVTEQVSVSEVGIEGLVHLSGADERGEDTRAELREWLELAADGDWLALAEATGPATERPCLVGSGARWLSTLLEAPVPPAEAIHAIVRTLNGLGEAGAAPDAGDGAGRDAETEVSLADLVMEVQKTILAAVPGTEDWCQRLPSIVETLGRVIFATSGRDIRVPLSAAAAEALASASPQPVLAVLSAVTSSTAAPQMAADNAVAGRDAREPSKAEGEKILKVEQSRVDAIMDLVGELVVAKNALPYLARRAENDFNCRELAREIKHQYSALDRITQSMQSAIMQIRMMPVGSLFGRYPRLVRDISRKLGKEIELVIEGEDTEADKNVIEALSDPLLHIMRNSLDHGIEEVEDRIAAGKRRTAVIRIRAFQEGDRVCIEVTDDGRGIDPERIKGKALAKGLIEAERAAAMSAEEAVQLVFLAGFSTRDEASDLSGRGVGMDVVRTTVEHMGGDVSLSSTTGVGTRILLRLPLSMAVTRVMMVEVAGTLIGIPMETVAETVRVPAASIRRFKQAEMFLLRDALVPLVRMRTRLALAADAEPRPSEAVLVCRLHGAPVGLVVDDFNVGIEVVLKPMSGLLAGLPGYAGTAVLGNGEVLLVLNLKELL